MFSSGVFVEENNSVEDEYQKSSGSGRIQGAVSMFDAKSSADHGHGSEERRQRTKSTRNNSVKNPRTPEVKRAYFPNNKPRTPQSTSPGRLGEDNRRKSKTTSKKPGPPPLLDDAEESKISPTKLKAPGEAMDGFGTSMAISSKKEIQEMFPNNDVNQEKTDDSLGNQKKDFVSPRKTSPKQQLPDTRERKDEPLRKPVRIATDESLEEEGTRQDHESMKKYFKIRIGHYPAFAKPEESLKGSLKKPSTHGKKEHSSKLSLKASSAHDMKKNATEEDMRKSSSHNTKDIISPRKSSQTVSEGRDSSIGDNFQKMTIRRSMKENEHVDLSKKNEISPSEHDSDRKEVNQAGIHQKLPVTPKISKAYFPRNIPRGNRRWSLAMKDSEKEKGESMNSPQTIIDIVASPSTSRQRMTNHNSGKSERVHPSRDADKKQESVARSRSASKQQTTKSRSRSASARELRKARSRSASQQRPRCMSRSTSIRNLPAAQSQSRVPQSERFLVNGADQENDAKTNRLPKHKETPHSSSEEFNTEPIIARDDTGMIPKERSPINDADRDRRKWLKGCSEAEDRVRRLGSRRRLLAAEVPRRDSKKNLSGVKKDEEEFTHRRSRGSTIAQDTISDPTENRDVSAEGIDGSKATVHMKDRRSLLKSPTDEDNRAWIRSSRRRLLAAESSRKDSKLQLFDLKRDDENHGAKEKPTDSGTPPRSRVEINEIDDCSVESITDLDALEEEAPKKATLANSASQIVNPFERRRRRTSLGHELLQKSITALETDELMSTSLHKSFSRKGSTKIEDKKEKKEAVWQTRRRRHSAGKDET